MQDKLRKIADKVLGIVKKVFDDPDKKKAITSEIAKKGKISIREKLEQTKIKVAMQENKNVAITKNKQHDISGGR